jgi:hypothetical protein
MGPQLFVDCVCYKRDLQNIRARPQDVFRFQWVALREFESSRLHHSTSVTGSDRLSVRLAWTCAPSRRRGRSVAHLHARANPTIAVPRGSAARPIALRFDRVDGHRLDTDRSKMGSCVDVGCRARRPRTMAGRRTITRSIQLKSSTVRPTSSGWRATCSASAFSCFSFTTASAACAQRELPQ